MLRGKLIYIFLLFTLLSSNSFGQSKMLLASIQQASVGGNDADAQAFIDAVGTLNATEETAINNLVIALKANGTWTKYKAIYPFIGGTAAEHKWNLKDPRDLDAAYRITFTGTITHDANGISADGSTGYGDTHLVPASVLINSSYSMSVYYRSDVSEGSGIGVKDGTGYWTFYPEFGGDFYSYAGSASNSITVAAIGVSSGMFTNTQNGGTTHKAFRNGSQIGTTNTGDNTASFDTLLEPMYVGAVNRDGVAGEFSSRNIAFFAIADGLSDAEVSDDYTDIQAFQTELSRNL